MKTGFKIIILNVLITSVTVIIMLFCYHTFYYNPDLYTTSLSKEFYTVSNHDRTSQPFNVMPSSLNFVKAADEGKKGVVYISTAVKELNANESQARNSGSGVIISADGYIVTNYHVIKEAKTIDVTLYDKRKFVAKIIGSDASTDLALLKIETENLPFLPVGNSDSLKVGQWVLAVGNPFKLRSTVTAGIISAKARSINLLESNGVESYIQTDAAVNPGNSGGALLNTDGELVGVCAAILSKSGNYEGFSFAIPSAVVSKVVKDLREFGAVQRGWLGVDIESIDNSLAQKLKLEKVSGVYIGSVSKDGSAYDAGLKYEDVITHINEKVIEDVAGLMETLSRYRPGDILALRYIRENKVMNCFATLKNQINTVDLLNIKKDPILEEIGIEIRILDSYEKASLLTAGIKVISVKDGSIISKIKLEPGYIVTKINNRQLFYPNVFIEVLKQNRGKTVVLEGFYQNYPGEYPYVFIVPKTN